MKRSHRFSTLPQVRPPALGQPATAIMASACAWCGCALPSIDGLGQTGMSHGICSECYDVVLADAGITGREQGCRA